MQLVAIARLATSIEEAAQALAAGLGTTAYAERHKLAAGLPAVVLSTPDPARAAALADQLAARGHGVVTCDTDDVVANGEMPALRRFALDDDALIAESERPEGALPWADVAALLRATHRLHTRSTSAVKEKRLSLGMALATGGMMTRKTTTREVVSSAEEHEPVLYLFRRSGQPPWILRQHQAQYAALGARLAATAAPNFTATVEELRRRAPGAVYDDRLLARKVPPDELDRIAHLLVLSLRTA